MKTKIVNAEDVPGNAKIVLNGTVRQLCDCDYVIPEVASTVRFDFLGGDYILTGSLDPIEMIVED